MYSIANHSRRKHALRVLDGGKTRLLALYILVLTALLCLPASAQSGLQVGGQAINTSDIPLRVRTGAGSEHRKIGELQTGEVVTLLAGPVAAGDHVWWQVEKPGLIGWAAEGKPGNYWLEPYGEPAAEEETASVSESAASEAAAGEAPTSIGDDSRPCIFADESVTGLASPFRLAEESFQGAISYGESVTGVLTKAMNWHNYELYAAAGDAITIDVSQIDASIDSYHPGFGIDICKVNVGHHIYEPAYSRYGSIPSFVIPRTGLHGIWVFTPTSDNPYLPLTYSLDLHRVGSGTLPATNIRYGETRILNEDMHPNETECTSYYSFAANTGDIIRMSLQFSGTPSLTRLGDYGRLTLWLYDSAGRPIKVIKHKIKDSGDPNLSTEDIVLTKGGVYHVGASQEFLECQTDGNTALFTLERTGSEPPEPSLLAAESGDALLAHGSLNDANFYGDHKFDARAGERITIAMVRTSGNLDPALRLYDSSATELAYDDNSGPGNDALISDFRIPADGEYTIHTLRTAAGQAGAYELSLTLVEAPVEPAQPIACGETVSGEITDDDWRDFWQFQGLADQNVSISMWGAGLESSLVLSDSSGVVQGRSSGIGDAYLEGTMPADEVYTIEATRRAEASGATTGEYSLYLECDIVYVPPLDPDLVALSVGRPIGGCLNEGDDYQLFQLRLTEMENTISLRMAALRLGLVPGLTLFDINGNEVATDENARDADLAQLPNVNLGPGLYSISAWSVRGGGCYTLEAMDYWLPPVEEGALPLTADSLIDNLGFQISALYGLDSGLYYTRHAPSNCAYGEQDVCDLTPLDILEISGAVDQGVALCFPQEGIIAFMPATGADVTTLRYETSEGRTCTRLDEAGRIALLSPESEDRFIERHGWQINAIDRFIIRPSAFVVDVVTTAGGAKLLKGLKLVNPKYLGWLETALTIAGVGKVAGITDGTVLEMIPTGVADLGVIVFYENKLHDLCLLKPHQPVYLRDEPSLTAGTLGTLDTPYYSVPSYLRIDDEDNWWWGLMLFKQGTASIFRPDDAEVAVGWVRAESVEMTSKCTDDLFDDDYFYDESAPDQYLSSDFSNLSTLENCELTVYEGYDPLPLRRSPGGTPLLDANDELLIVPEITLLRAVEMTDQWVRVEYDGKSGWVPKYFNGVVPTDETEANCWDSFFQ